MNQLRLIPFLTLAILFSSCISSGESGSEREAPITKEPAAVQAPAQSQPQGGSSPSRESASREKQQSRSKLTSRRDTIVASVTRKNRPAARIARPERPRDPSYTVQIGSFAKPSNALACQKKVKERFPKNSVHNRYDANAKLYRVSVGKYTTKQEAIDLRREVLKRFPKEYAQAWVNYIPR